MALEFGLDHWIEHCRVARAGGPWLRREDPDPCDPDGLVRHLYEAHEITVTELDDRDVPFMWPLFHIFDRHQLSAHDEAHGGEDVLGLCIFFDRKLDRYREEQRRSKLSKVDRQAEDWARYRREAEDALSPAARRCPEEVRASGGTKTYTGGEDFEAVRWLELRQTMWYKDGPRDYQPGEPKCLVEVSWAEDSVTVKAL